MLIMRGIYDIKNISIIYIYSVVLSSDLYVKHNDSQTE